MCHRQILPTGCVVRRLERLPQFEKIVLLQCTHCRDQRGRSTHHTGTSVTKSPIGTRLNLHNNMPKAKNLATPRETFSPPEQRLPVLVAARNAKMARSAHAYVRGNTARFYDWLDSVERVALPEGPTIWICGDCHIGNLGPVADNSRRTGHRNTRFRPDRCGKPRP